MAAHTSYPEPVQHTSLKLTAALAYARRGFPVFPVHSIDDTGACTCGKPKCKDAGKHPRYQKNTLEHGCLDATTDPQQIREWWTRWPDANIGLVTGERSGLLVIDVDPRHGGDESLDALEAKHGPLPRTWTVRTGGDGQHIYLKYPTGSGIGLDNSGKLGDGLDVKGEGGYVLAPPSRTTSPYKPVLKASPADTPDYLPKLLRRQPRTADKPLAGPGRSVDRLAPIPPPETVFTHRNPYLASVGGRLHDGTRSLAELEAALAEINARFPEPKSPAEVAKVARSIYKTPPCKPVKPGPPPDALEALDGVEAALWRRDWRGMGGKSERDVLVALVKIARRHGESIPAGVRVTVDYRTLALAAATSVGTAHRAIQRLRRKDLVRYDNEGREDSDAGALVVVARKVEHSTHSLLSGGGEAGGKSVPPCAPPAHRSPHRTLTAPRLRWSSREIRRLGKSCGQAVDTLENAGGSLTLVELAEAMGVKRSRDLKRRVIDRLEVAAVVECSGEIVALTADWLDALNIERERAGEIERSRLDVARYDREREAYARRHEHRPDPVPAPPEPAPAPSSSRCAPVQEEEEKRPDEPRCGPVQEPKEPPAKLELPLHNTCEMVNSNTAATPGRTGAEPRIATRKPTREELRAMWADPRKEAFHYPERYREAG